MEIDIGWLRTCWRPGTIGLPGVRSRLEGTCPPRKLIAGAMQKVAKERSLDLLAKFARGLMASERDLSDIAAFRRLPFPVKPGAGHNEILIVGVALLRVAEDLPGTPRIFLIPKSSHIQAGNRASCAVGSPMPPGARSRHNSDVPPCPSRTEWSRADTLNSGWRSVQDSDTTDTYRKCQTQSEYWRSCLTCSITEYSKA